MPSSSAKPPVTPLTVVPTAAESFEASSTATATATVASHYGAISLPPIYANGLPASPPSSPPDVSRKSSPSLSSALAVASEADAFAKSSSPVSAAMAAASPPLRREGTLSASASYLGIPMNLSANTLRNTLMNRGARNAATSTTAAIDWQSLYVVYVLTLVAEAARGLLLPSTWPYFHALGGAKQSLGFFVASFSFGRMVSSVPLGYLSDNMPIAHVLIVASCTQIIGHILYILAPTLPCLYAARIVVGFGSATMSVCRSHLSRAVPSRIRTHHFAYLSALQFVGFAVLPGVGGLLSLLPIYEITPTVTLNGFTYPALILVLANFACIFLICKYYIEPGLSPPRSALSTPTVLSRNPSSNMVAVSANDHNGNKVVVDQNSNTGTATPSEEAQSPDQASPTPTIAPRPDVVAFSICLLINVVFRGVIAEFETVSVPFLTEQYGVSYGTGSFFLSSVGFVGMIVYVCFKPISQRISDRALIVVGLFVTIIGCLPLTLAQVSRHLPINVYVVCLGLTWSIAFPAGQTATLALFSKVLDGLPAGGLLGIFSATGSVARLTMAVLASQMWNESGREAVFQGIVVYVTVAVVVVMACYHRLAVPS